MKTIKFKGTPYQIGFKEGKFYKKEKLILNKNIDKKILNKQLKIYQKYYPEYLEKLQGIAKAMDEKLKIIQFNFLASPLIQLQKKIKKENGCTIFGVKTKETTIVGRNYDWINLTKKVFTKLKFKIKNKIPFFAISDMGIWKNKEKNLQYDTIDIINKKGLYIGLTFAYSNKYNYGIWPTHMISLIGESCSSVKETINLFKKVPIACPKNFFIADVKGDFCVIQHTSKKFKKISPKKNILIQTNNYTNKDLKKEDTVLKENPENDTFIRYYETLQAINHYKRKLTLNKVKKILNNKKTSIFEKKKSIETIWTLTLDMKNKKYKIYYDFGKKIKHKNLFFWWWD